MVTRNKRGLQWFTSVLSMGALSDSGQTNLPLYTVANVSAQFIKGSTVTRTLVDIRIAANSVAQRVILFCGLVVINADAASAGVFPDPGDSSDRAGWLGRWRMETIQDSLSDSSQEDHVKLDLRSQRILRAEEDEYHLIVQNLSGSSFVLNWEAYVRALIRLP